MDIQNKKVTMDFDCLIGDNAFKIIGTFESNAKKQGWTKEEIDKVINKAISDNYTFLLRTIKSNVVDIGCL